MILALYFWMQVLHFVHEVTSKFLYTRLLVTSCYKWSVWVQKWSAKITIQMKKEKEWKQITVSTDTGCDSNFLRICHYERNFKPSHKANLDISGALSFYISFIYMLCKNFPLVLYAVLQIIGAILYTLFFWRGLKCWDRTKISGSHFCRTKPIHIKTTKPIQIVRFGPVCNQDNSHLHTPLSY